MDKTICQNPRDPNSDAWCSGHKEQADKVWLVRDPRMVDYESKHKKPAIPTVEVSESYL